MEHVIHQAKDRGVAEHGWLHTRFSFSFAHWYDPERMGFGALRVINDDALDPESGFDLHPHDNMEIITIVTEGTITHGDSMGNKTQVPAGDVQVMSAGTGVVHSEHNFSSDQDLRLFQIWIIPKTRGIAPKYGQKSFGTEWTADILQLLVSPDGREDSLAIHQDAFVYRGHLTSGKTTDYSLKNASRNGIYILVIEGGLDIHGHKLGKRDAIGLWDTDTIRIQADRDCTYLLFEVPLEF